MDHDDDVPLSSRGIIRRTNGTVSKAQLRKVSPGA